MTLTTAVVIFALSQASKPVTTIVFGEEKISGERKRPELEHIDSRPPTKFSNLIKIRENFADKIVKSVDEM